MTARAKESGSRPAQTRKPPVADAEESSRRRSEIMDVAMRLFREKGYEGVSVREIADAAGILGGSLYHHFTSKRDLYVEVHRQVMQRASSEIAAEAVRFKDPWDKLQAAAALHLTMHLDPNSITTLMVSDRASLTGDMRDELVSNRDGFERVYKDLVAGLPLPADIDRNVFRVCLLSLLNGVPTWYRRGKLTPAEVATQIVRMIRF